MINPHLKDEEKFLTTFPTWDLVGLVKSLQDKPIAVCLILVQARESKTGLLEEKGDLILKIWGTVLENFPLIQGQRLNWSSLVFFSQHESLDKIKQKISSILIKLKNPQIKSLAICSVIQNSANEKLKEVEKMELQLGKLNYWKEHLYPSYFEDGIEKSLIHY